MQYLLAKNELKTAYHTSWIEDAHAIFYQALSDQSISQQQQPKENTMLRENNDTSSGGNEPRDEPCPLIWLREHGEGLTNTTCFT